MFSPLSLKQEAYIVHSEEMKKELAVIAQKNVPGSCFLQMHELRPFPKPPSVICPTAPTKIAKELGHPTSVAELTKSMELTSYEREQLQTATQGQSTSNDWKEQRHGRITASNFHRVNSRMKTLLQSPDSSADKLVSTLMGYDPPFTTIATKHGHAMEPHAKKKLHSPPETWT